MNRSTLVIAIAALAAFAAGAFFALSARHPADFAVATVFDTPRRLPQISLLDESGAKVDLARFSGHWDILFFGFTHCPDVCPTTLFQLKGLRARLDNIETARRPRIWLVTVDPQRDTPQILQRYLAHFGAGFAGLTGSDEEIARLAASLGVAYQRIDEGEDYTMSHSAALFVVDPHANYVALFSTPHDMATISTDYKLLTK